MSDTIIEADISAKRDKPESFPTYQTPEVSTAEYAANFFVISQLISQISTAALVRVVSVTTNGGVAPVGFVDVLPMANQLDSSGNPTSHDTVHNIPYFRLQGGTNAIIIDPVAGDIGLAVFCNRDISTVKRTKAVANPASRRTFDWADGLYFGSFLGAAPTQDIQFNASGITISSPNAVTINAPNITITATNITLNGTVTINGNVATTGTLTNNGHAVGSTHLHTASGGTGLGGPPV